MVSLTKEFVYKNFHNRFIQWIKNHSKIETFVDTRKDNPFTAANTVITGLTLFRPFRDLDKCNVFGYSKDDDANYELSDYWFDKTLSAEEKKRLEDEKKRFHEYYSATSLGLF